MGAGPPRAQAGGWYLVAAEAVAGVEDEGLLPLVVLPHIQALVEFQVPDLRGEQVERPVRELHSPAAGVSDSGCSPVSFPSAHSPHV